MLFVDPRALAVDLQALAINLGQVAGLLLALGVIGAAAVRLWRFFAVVDALKDLLIGDPKETPPIPSLAARLGAIESLYRQHLNEHHGDGGTVRQMQPRRQQGHGR